MAEGVWLAGILVLGDSADDKAWAAAARGGSDEADEADEADTTGDPAGDDDGGQAVSLTFRNDTAEPLTLCWVDNSSRRASNGKNGSGSGDGNRERTRRQR